MIKKTFLDYLKGYYAGCGSLTAYWWMELPPDAFRASTSARYLSAALSFTLAALHVPKFPETELLKVTQESMMSIRH